MEQLYGVQDYQIDTEYQEDPLDNNKKNTLESIDIEIKDRDNTNSIPRRENSGKGIKRLEIKLGVNKYCT